MSAVGQVRPNSRLAPNAAVARPLRGPDVTGAPTRPPLRVVPPDQIKLRARRRRDRALMITVGLIIALGMFAIVGAQVVLTQRQLRLDTMAQKLSQAQTSNDELQLQVATLESPSRIVSAAQTQLHMLLPTSVVYLTPGAAPGTIKVKGVPAGVIQGGAAPATPATRAAPAPSSSGAPG